MDSGKREIRVLANGFEQIDLAVLARAFVQQPYRRPHARARGRARHHLHAPVQHFLAGDDGARGVGSLQLGRALRPGAGHMGGIEKALASRLDPEHAIDHFQVVGGVILLFAVADKTDLSVPVVLIQRARMGEIFFMIELPFSHGTDSTH